MLRQALAWIAAALVGVALGAASAWAAINLGASAFSETYGAWTHSRAAGSRAADPYTRAIIARAGLLALNASEARYYTLARDERGRPLQEDCIYQLAGRDLDTRWWSVTIYASDHYLVQNTDHAAAVDATHVRAGADGFWRVRVAPVRGDAVHWLSSRNAGRGFSLTLRVYNPNRDFRASEETLPVLTTVSCAGDAA